MTRTSKFWSFSADHFLLIGLVIKPPFAACWQGRAYKRRNGPILDYHIFFMWVEGDIQHTTLFGSYLSTEYMISAISNEPTLLKWQKNSFLALFLHKLC